MKKTLVAFLLFGIIPVLLPAQAPVWLTERLRSDEYFYGRGEGLTAAEAEEAGKEEILLQLTSQINGVIRIQSASTGAYGQMTEEVESFIGTARLRSAEVAERYQAGGRHYALISYSAECGLTMARSAVMLYQEELGVEVESVIEELDDGAMLRGARIERVISDASSGDYGSDLTVQHSGEILRLSVLNFEGYGITLTPTQRRGLQEFSETLFRELEEVEYRPAKVEGHANPTGEENEGEALLEYSKGRAETMATFLREAGIEVGEVIGQGGGSLLGNPATEEGRGLNRRVEIEIEILPWGARE